MPTQQKRVVCPQATDNVVESSLLLSQRGQSVGHAHLRQVLKPLSSPVDLPLDTPGMLNATRLLLDSRVVDMLMASTPNFVMLPSLKPLFFKEA